jgi:hypothetical protein
MALDDFNQLLSELRAISDHGCTVYTVDKISNLFERIFSPDQPEEMSDPPPPK